MKTLAIATQKGGSGKSTVAIHLAVAAEIEGSEVLIADLDPHSQTAAEWASERSSERPVVIKLSTKDIETLKQQAIDEGFDLLILDCPPYIDDVITQATKFSDFTLIPAQPRFADLRTLPRVIEKVHPPFAVVLNSCTPGFSGQESSKTSEARRLLIQSGIPVSQVSLIRREAFTDALNGGKAVVEFESYGKAANEVNKLWSWLQEELK